MILDGGMSVRETERLVKKLAREAEDDGSDKRTRKRMRP